MELKSPNLKQLKKKKNPSKTKQSKMTQKGNLFKGQQKKKTVPPNRHGKIIQARKGKWIFI